MKRTWRSPTLQAALWAALVAVTLSLPGRLVPQARSGWHLDKLVHAVLFFVLLVLSRRSLETKRSQRSAGILALCVTIPYAFLLEYVQRLVPNRSFDPWDLAAGLVGIMLAFLLQMGSRLSARRAL